MGIRHFAYFVVLGLCLLVTLPLELGLGARVWSRPRALLTVIVPVAVVFSLIDVVAIAAGLWTYDRAQTTGVELPGSLPIEELAFFVIIPICAVLTFEAVGRVSARRPRRPGRAGHAARPEASGRA